MKAGKILIAGVVISVFSTIFGMVTCGWLFSWVYKLEPVGIWKSMEGPPGAMFFIGALVLNIIFVLVYVLLRKGIPGKNKLIKGLMYGLCVWAVGILPGMFSMYSFMTVATGVLVYWAIQGLIETPLAGLITAAICGE